MIVAAYIGIGLALLGLVALAHLYQSARADDLMQRVQNEWPYRPEVFPPHSD